MICQRATVITGDVSCIVVGNIARLFLCTWTQYVRPSVSLPKFAPGKSGVECTGKELRMHLFIPPIGISKFT